MQRRGIFHRSRIGQALGAWARTILLTRRLRPVLWMGAPLLLLLLSLTAAGLVGGQELVQRPPSTRATLLETPAPPTWTPTVETTRPAAAVTATPTATSPGASPLATPTAGTLVAQVVVPAPHPSGLFGPRLMPITDTVEITGTEALTVAEAPPPTRDEVPTPTGAAALIRLPTPTPVSGTVAGTAPVSPTEPLPSGLTLVEALQLPVADEPAATPAPTPAPALEPTPDGTVRTVQVPILMYHYLSVPPPDADRYRIDLSVTPELFAAHLDAMQQAGYTPISLYTLQAYLTQGVPLTDKPVVLTFDDGYRDNYEHAFPLLRERGMTATFFIVTDFVDDQRPEYLTWDMVREMYAGGMSIESHGRNHVSLKGKDSDYLVWQALGSLETIQHELGVRPRFVSYPAGEYDRLTIDIFRSAGYWAGMTTVQGATHHSDDLFQIRRVRVRGSTTPEELQRLLALDW